MPRIRYLVFCTYFDRSLCTALILGSSKAKSCSQGEELKCRPHNLGGYVILQSSVQVSVTGPLSQVETHGSEIADSLKYTEIRSNSPSPPRTRSKDIFAQKIGAWIAQFSADTKGNTLCRIGRPLGRYVKLASIQIHRVPSTPQKYIKLS